MKARFARRTASVCLVALIVLCAAWELWLSPLRPGSSWLALKALPLLAPLAGVLRGRVYTYQWTLLLVPLYFAEGVVRAWSERMVAAQLASVEIVLSISLFTAAIAYVRWSRQPS